MKKPWINPEDRARLYVRIFNKTLEGMIITDEQTNIISVNPMFTAITGYTEEEVLGKKPTLLKSGVHQREFYQKMWASIRQTGSWQGEIWNKRKNGEIYPEWLTINAVYDDQNRLANFIGIFSDISERKKTESQLRLFAKVFESASLGIMITGTDLKIISVNPAFTYTTGYQEKDVIGGTPAILRSNIQKPEFYAEMWRSIHETGAWQGEIWNRRKNGEIYPEWLTINTLRDENHAITHYIGIFSDITERKKTEERLRFLAHYDMLTGLSNRLSVQEQFQQVMLRARRHNLKVAVFFVDLDRFKLINDSLGHAMGDRLLKLAAERMLQCVPQNDTIARLGGDEFIIVCENIHSSDDAIQLAQKIASHFERPFFIDHHELFMNVSIGISVYPLHGQDFETLIKHADLAMYQAKESKKRYQLFNRQIDEIFQRKITLENGLRKALEKNQFVLYFQPQMNVTSGAVEGMEALLRWRHEQLGIVLPGDFIPIAEESGFIHQIGEWVIREVCGQIKLWQSAGYRVPYIAINISAREFGYNHLIRTIRSIMTETGLNADGLVFEITESISIHQIDSILNTLHDLKKIGVRVAIDDFGKGYSALSYLKHLPIDFLKIDKCFIRDIHADERDAVLVQAIINMAHGMGLKVIAEGVETAKQLACLKQLKCDMMQGHLIGRPVPAEIASRFLQRS